MSTYDIVAGSTRGLTNTEDFLELLDSLPDTYRDFFSGSDELIITRAPGRLDVMGGIADYSGSLVLQLPIADAAHVALQKNSAKTIRLVSLPTSTSTTPRFFEMDLEHFLSPEGPIDYSSACLRFGVNDTDHWAAYVAGAFLVLMREKGLQFIKGANIVIRSNVPEGKGVSSSAALEVAAMQAVVTAFDIEISGQELALLCQKVENLVAGAPCGVMDQMTAACGESGQLLELLCQPCDLKGTVAVPDELKLWGLDSGVRHSVGGSDYGTVRTAAFMGLRIISEMAGLAITKDPGTGKVRIADSKWNGYLANLTPEEFERSYAPSIPERLMGGEFLERYEGITDDVTSVRPDVEYPVRQATSHPIYEHRRVKTFATILKKWNGAEQAKELGKLMLESHQSYSNCGLGSDKTDLIVALVRDSLNDELYGARITGGGSGGTVAVLGSRAANDVIENIARRFEESTGYQPLVISGSSPGASTFNHLKLTKKTSTENARSI